MTTIVLAPCGGAVRPITESVDAVFAQEIVGPGVLIRPEPGTTATSVLSPIAGRLVKVHPHAFVVLSADGVGVLVHLGIDTVRLEGRGFEVLAEQGTEVAAGDPVVRWDPTAIAAQGLATEVPVVLMDRPKGSVTPAADHATPGVPLFSA